MIGEGVLAMEYGASAEDVARTTHAHVRSSLPFCLFCDINLHAAYTFRGVQGGSDGRILEAHPHVISYLKHLNRITLLDALYQNPAVSWFVVRYSPPRPMSWRSWPSAVQQGCAMSFA